MTALGGQVGVITGGGRGLGAILAEALAKEGMSLCLTGRSPSSLERTAAKLRMLGAQSLAVPADVTDEAAIEVMLARAESELGPIDLLVNNAGMTAYGNLWECDSYDWWRVVEVNLRGPFLTSRVILRGMVQRGRGRIVNVASYAGNGPSIDQVAYAVSKAAVIRLTDCMAAQVSGRRIGVFAMSPGLVRTDMGIDVQRRRGNLADADWVPTRLAADLVTKIARGSLDRLSGRFIHVQDNTEEMLDRLTEIQDMDLYQLRLRKLPSAKR